MEEQQRPGEWPWKEQQHCFTFSALCFTQCLHLMFDLIWFDLISWNNEKSRVLEWQWPKGLSVCRIDHYRSGGFLPGLFVWTLLTDGPLVQMTFCTNYVSSFLHQALKMTLLPTSHRLPTSLCCQMVSFRPILEVVHQLQVEESTAESNWRTGSRHLQRNVALCTSTLVAI